VLPSSTDTDFNGVVLKAEPEINSTFRGITSDSSFERENASDPIRFNDDGDSNEIDESDLHESKHDDPRILIYFGMTIYVTSSNP
jgi:hypothetical protein